MHERREMKIQSTYTGKATLRVGSMFLFAFALNKIIK